MAAVVGAARQTVPVPPASAAPDPDRAWRLEVGRFRDSRRARVFPMEVLVGEPSAARVGLEVPWPVPPEYDAGLRFDLALALVERWPLGPAFRPPAAWVARMGAPEPHDEDHLWHAAAVRAFAAHGWELDTFRVVTRAGWLDLRTGRTRTWVRLRL
jgi:hypothetical protein